LDESGAGNSPIILLPTPGTKKFAQFVPPPPTFNPTPLFAYNIPHGGLIVGQTVTGVLALPPAGGQYVQPPVAIQVGDMMFILVFYNFTGTTGTVDSIADHGPLASWAPLTPMIPYTGPASTSFTSFGYQVFYGKATVPFPAATGVSSAFAIDMTWSAGTNVHSVDIGTMTFLAVRGVSALDQLAYGTVAPAAIQIAPTITTSADAFVLSFIAAGTNGFSVPAPFYLQGGLLSFVAARSDGGFIFTSPSGAYAAPWNNLDAGFPTFLSTAAAIMASFV
jgi:hypothetical protein